jgi:signal transduction histidine kinase
MGKTEITIFIILANIVLLIFITGILLFILQYRRKKKGYEKEKAMIHELHRVELLNTQLEIQSRTMRQIGREIHDSVGQKLTLASLYTNQLMHENAWPEGEAKITAVGHIINESLVELRTLSKTLTNPELAHATLTSLLEMECQQINAAGTCVATLDSSEGTCQLPEAEKNMVYRIVQEFIQNSLKHAACKRISIHIRSAEDALLVDIADDGKGFDVHLVSSGIGLGNMKQRAMQAGAVFNLQSEPGQGTKLVLRIPVKQ